MTPGVEMPGIANFMTEAFFAAAVTAIGELVGAELAGCRIEFTFEPAMPEEDYRRLLGMPVSFGKSGNRFIGPREAVDLPLVAAGNVVADMYVRQCGRSEEHTSELQSLMRISYAVFCLKKKKQTT